MSDTLSDRALVSELLERTAHLSQLEVDARVPGVTQSDVSRWRRGAFQRLTAAKRRAIKRWLERGQVQSHVEVQRNAMLRAAQALRDEASDLEDRAAKLSA